jgi:hypothetical protein
LLTALQSYESGSTIQIFEKRKIYTRNTWLDLYPQPYSYAYDIMMKFGFSNFIEHVPQNIGNTNQTVITIRTQILEQFLLKIARMIGIQVHFGFEFLEKGSTEEKIAVRNLETNEIQYHEYNVLIGADAVNSGVRSFQKNSFEAIDIFKLKNGEKIQIPNVSQLSFLVNFDSKDNECPELRDKSELIISDPWMMGFEVKGIHSVFKRWYLGHCQLQILFLDYYSEIVLENLKKDLIQYLWNKYTKKSFKKNHENDRYPLAILFSILSKILKNPPKSHNEMLELISKNKTGMLDLFLLNTKIRKVEKTNRILRSKSIISLVGDASVTAHFRLGVGINNGFLSFQRKEFSRLLNYLNSIGKWKIRNMETNQYKGLQYLVEQKNELEMKRIDSLVQYQVSTIFYESFCNYVVFGSHDADLQDIYGKDYQYKEFYQLNHQEIEDYCGIKKIEKNKIIG